MEKSGAREGTAAELTCRISLRGQATAATAEPTQPDERRADNGQRSRFRNGGGNAAQSDREVEATRSGRGASGGCGNDI